MAAELLDDVVKYLAVACTTLLGLVWKNNNDKHAANNARHAAHAEKHDRLASRIQVLERDHVTRADITDLKSMLNKGFHDTQTRIDGFHAELLVEARRRRSTDGE